MHLTFQAHHSAGTSAEKSPLSDHIFYLSKSASQEFLSRLWLSRLCGTLPLLPLEYLIDILSIYPLPVDEAYYQVVINMFLIVRLNGSPDFPPN